jgi:ATP-binding cassette subfamily A (ABC1) protein 3
VQEPPKQQEHSEYTDFSSIPIPDCLHEPPSYSFGNQFHACFLRKFYTTRIGKKMVMQFLVPIYFEVIAALLCYLNRDNFHTPEELLAFASIGVTFELAFGMCISAASIAGSPVQEREEKLKYALNVMGCRIVPYWLATMAFDCLVSFFQIVIFIILLAAL